MKKQNVIINGAKGMYTIEEVCELLRKNNVNFKIVMKGRSNTISQTHCKQTPASTNLTKKEVRN